MLTAAIICPEETLRKELEATLANVPDLEIGKTLATYPMPQDLLRLIRIKKIDILFLSIGDWAQAGNIAKHVDDILPGFSVVSLGERDGVKVLQQLMKVGIRTHLVTPLNVGALQKAVAQAANRQKRHPPAPPVQADLYTFLPAKPEVGTSTITVATSYALAEDLKARTLLLDADLYAGAIRFLLGLKPFSSFVNALMQAESLDDDMWTQLIGTWKSLEVLHAGDLNFGEDVNPASVAQFLTIARPQYEVICADLGSRIDRFSIALLRQSRRIYLTTSPGLVPLHMAQVRADALKALGLEDRVSLLVNKKAKGSISDDEIAKIVGLPVSHTFPEDRRAVQRSVLETTPIPQGTELGKSILNFAQTLVPHHEVEPASASRKFLEFFHIRSSADAEGLWHT